MRHALPLLLALLPGCVTVPAEGVDVHRVVWVQVDDANRICTEMTGAAPLFLRIKGCVVRRDGLCTIYSPRPKASSDLQAFVTLGHELMHCMEGDWHDKWGDMTRGKNQ